MVKCLPTTAVCPDKAYPYDFSNITTLRNNVGKIVNRHKKNHLLLRHLLSILQNKVN